MLEHSIVPVAYCPIGRPSAPTDNKQSVDLKYTKVPDLREDKAVQALAAKYGKSELQVILRWGIERGHAIIPKSSHSEHQKQNIEVFDFKL